MMRGLGAGIGLVVVLGVLPAGAEETGIDVTATGYLVKSWDGPLFVREPVAVTGMFWVSGTAYRVSPDLAERLTPLVVTESDGSVFDRVPNGMPREPREGDPVPILTVRVRLSPVVPDEGSNPRRFARPDISSIYRVSSVDVIDAEFVGYEWYSELKRMNETLEEVLPTTLEAPGEEKRKHLGDLVEQGGRSLRGLMQPRVREEWRELVHGFSPDATMETRWQRKKAMERGRILGVCATRLGIEPETPLPAEIEAEVRETSNATVASGSFEIEKTGLIVRLLGPDELAKYLALEGFVIEDADGNRSGFAVQPGDVILVRPYLRDLAKEIANDDPATAERYLRQKAESHLRGYARQNRSLRVIRFGEAVDLAFTEGGKRR